MSIQRELHDEIYKIDYVQSSNLYQWIRPKFKIQESHDQKRDSYKS